MVCHKNDIPQLHIGFLKYYQNLANVISTPTTWHKRVIGTSLWNEKNSTLKSYDHEPESYNKHKNFFLKITQLKLWEITFGNFFARCSIFVL